MAMVINNIDVASQSSFGVNCLFFRIKATEIPLEKVIAAFGLSPASF